MTPVPVGVIGCGTIAPQYFRGCKRFPILEVVACADLDLDRARSRAAEFGVPRACSVDELLADPAIEVVVDLTNPAAHADVNLAILEAGKHVHTEKPLAAWRGDGGATVDAAARHGRRLSVAPDTLLGGGLQTCKQVVDEGRIGEPVAATALFGNHGNESWHANPGFYYQPGGSPMLAMGVYYVSALAFLLGPITRVSGSTRISFPERTVTSESPLRGQKIPVNVPTHITGTMDFAQGAVATVVQSYDIWAHHMPLLEIHGSEGSLSVPDPNTFGGPVQLRLHDGDVWEDVPLTHDDQVRRGVGAADLVSALVHDRPHRLSAELGYHVLDVMLAFDDSSRLGAHVHIDSTFDSPEPLPRGLPPGVLDAR